MLSDRTVELYKKIKNHEATEFEEMEFEMDIGTYSWGREFIIEKLEEMISKQ